MENVVSNIDNIDKVSKIVQENGFGVVSFSILVIVFIFVIVYFLNNNKKLTNQQIDTLKDMNKKTDILENNMIELKGDMNNLKEGQKMTNDILIQITKSVEISEKIQGELEKVNREIIGNNTKALYRNSNAFDQMRESQVQENKRNMETLEIIKDLIKK